ncbi:GntR family transcriptional regulator [Bosea sp. LjRoot237]|uniref:GntR family transcriptional regulator n=1 Tax=Bosea sp. LjRoot237 TaxID=3342292 RepID=UPI003ED03815
MPDLKVEQPKSLVTIVEERLRNAIVDAEMGFGESLSEEALSEALGVSRTPVREALARLQLQGLVTIVPKKGTFVFAPTEEDVAELCVFRFMLETQALRECMAKGRVAALAAMNNGLAAMEAALAGGTRHDYARADTDFHEVFFQHCGNRYLANAYRGVSGRVAALRTHLSVPLEGEQERSMAEHRLMVETFAAGRLADLDAILHRHIMRAWDAYADVLRRGDVPA